MNSVLEVAYAWFGTLLEAFVTLTCDVANIVISTLSQTPDTSLSSDTSPDTSSAAVESNKPAAGSPLIPEKFLVNLPQFIQDLAACFVFDDFEFLLLKIFVGILVGNVCLIYVAWKIYGERISEFFMSDTPNIPPEELQRRIEELNLPRVHSQRY